MSWIIGILFGAFGILIWIQLDILNLKKKIGNTEEVQKQSFIEHENLYTTQEQYNRYDGTDY